MLSCCLYCRKNTESKSSKVARTKTLRVVLLSKFVVCRSWKLKFLNEEDGKGLLSNLTGIKIPVLRDVPILSTFF